ncbi:hypothetical protein DKM44_12200 [Deinococcus irradiatisoli]|uniref:DUF1648 domain-containing protein n=1 Tax=Deinococcus irradiatisoli TaxID=2202254 RepID=A0A2Z3JG03_9DEIO|nr:DUF1648 domain-containing protein [Deinococcus irradiatisoli]AWN23895.1 hypothetical protein DKM44_12200 [Deinococcus irradiatisoli]
MNPNFWRREWPTLLALAVNAGLILWSWPRLPAQVPVHWNLQGEVDRVGGRFEALALLPLILLAVSMLTLIVQRFQPRNGGVFSALRLGLALLGLCFTAQYLPGWNAARAALIGVGLLLTLLGNVMGKVQPSRWVGFRTPWTYRSKRAWHQSQRRSGVFLVVFGLLSVAAGLLTPATLLFPWIMPLGFLLGLFGGLGWLVYLSYRDYRRDPQPEPVGT